MTVQPSQPLGQSSGLSTAVPHESTGQSQPPVAKEARSSAAATRVAAATFFVPDTPTGEQTARAYEDLRRHAELTAGRPARPARIFKLSCRRAGADCETRVGAHDMSSGETVHAIFDVGHSYLVLGRGGHETVDKRQTYRAVEFD